MDLKTYFLTSVATKADFARAVGVSPALLHQWVEGIRPVATEHCAAIEAASGGKVSRRDLRPNNWRRIWPELKEAIPSSD